MTEGDDFLFVVCVDHDINTLEPLDCRCASHGSNQGLDRAPGHQIGDSTTPVIVSLPIGADEWDACLGYCALLGSLVGVARKLILACRMKGFVTTAWCSIVI